MGCTATATNRAEELLLAFRETRRFTEKLASPLEPEDCVIQSMPDVSPTRWHMAHTTWFFETFLLRDAIPGYVPHDPAYSVLFNSYYNGVGEQFPRDQRGFLSRPTVRQVLEYRRAVNEQVEDLLLRGDKLPDSLLDVVEIGINHEQQHQELIVTDIKHVLSCNPLLPAYDAALLPRPESPAPRGWTEFEGGVHEIGHEGGSFAFDNEGPRHKVYLEDFSLRNSPVTNREYSEFVADGGYRDPRHWLSAGWSWVKQAGLERPLYWRRHEGKMREFTLGGLADICGSDLPLCHVSYFEADAYARWAGARLPTEAEWETAALPAPLLGNFADVGRLHPGGSGSAASPTRMFGDVWEWTQSAYDAYPGYSAPSGALGEYNGKFMCGQFVLRGGSCATPAGHIRRTYRNFFPPDARWQFSGIRLAKQLG